MVKGHQWHQTPKTICHNVFSSLICGKFINNNRSEQKEGPYNRYPIRAKLNIQGQKRDAKRKFVTSVEINKQRNIIKTSHNEYP